MLYTERIKALRSDHDLNQTQVARAIHVAQTTYSDYEKGKVRIPVECLIQLAKFYDVDMNYITGVSDTLGNRTRPVFVEGGSTFTMDTILYNLSLIHI